MPIRTGKSVGSQNIAKGAVNLFAATGSIAQGGGGFISSELQCPGLPKLTFVAGQTLGTAGLSIQPQIAARVGQAGLLTWIDMGPPVVMAPAGTSVVFEFNCPVQAIRVLLTNVQNIDAGSATFLIAASA